MIEQMDYQSLQKAQHAYFIGIGGCGMSALARLLQHAGIKVSGSDIRPSKTTQSLMESGIQVHYGQQSACFTPDVDFLVYSSAIKENHVEYQEAKRNGKYLFHRAAVLSSFFNSAPTSIAVTGTHGKTTTSSMISFILKDLGKDPTCMVGGEIVDFGTNAICGHSGIYVSEVDESDQSHELFRPNYSIITNLEEEHVDHYKYSEQLRASFFRFIQNMHDPGLVVYSDDDVDLRQLVLETGRPRLSFGFSTSADYSARNILLSPSGASFDLYECGIYSARIQLKLLGLHNIANALASIALLVQMGLDTYEIANSISKFRGAKRRLEVRYQSAKNVIINDYAHNPTKVAASVTALKVFGGNVTVVFQPHRYSRTERFYREFAEALCHADEVYITDIYSAGEMNRSEVTPESIIAVMRQLGHEGNSYIEKDKIVPYLLDKNPSGVIAFLGAGDIGDIANEFTDQYKNLYPT